MENNIFEGTISFVHRDKQYVTIDYVHKDKKKSINGKVDEARQQKMMESKAIKKVHQFVEGDEVYFTIEPSARRDKMVAENIRYRFNNNLGNLINRARTNNQFTGYLKLADDKYFVKEAGSYLFFPLVLSPWELPPDAGRLNEPLKFQLQDIDKPEKVKASLLEPQYIPQFITAQKHFAKQTPLNATVYKVTEHGIYVNVIGDKLQAKIPKTNALNDALSGVKEGDRLKIIISYISSHKLVVKPV